MVFEENTTGGSDELLEQSNYSSKAVVCTSLYNTITTRGRKKGKDQEMSETELAFH